MPYLIGMDEAGYGPNLGPLVISASVWWLPDELAHADLYDLLADGVWHGSADEAAGSILAQEAEQCTAGAVSVAVAASRTAATRTNRLAIADSKRLYHPGSGLAGLEHGLLAVLRTLGHAPQTWRDVWRILAESCGAHGQPDPWYATFDRALPIDAHAEVIDEGASRLESTLHAAGVRCCGVASRAVFPAEFNDRCDEFDSKGEALTQFTLELLADVLQPLEAQPVRVTCDKHGGRHYYAGQLQQLAGDAFLEVRRESPAISTYRFGPTESQVEISFRAGGEQFLPTALASMASKYLRELAMLSFNEYWRTEVPDLRPTAGYPGDAKRFKRDIAQRQKSLAIDDERLWRKR